MFDNEEISKIWKCMNASGEVNKQEKDGKIKTAMYNMKRRLKNANNPTIISLMKTIIHMNDKYSSMENDYWWKNVELQDENKHLKDKYECMEKKLRELENKIERKEKEYNDLSIRMWHRRSQRPNDYTPPKPVDTYENLQRPLYLTCQDDSEE